MKKIYIASKTKHALKWKRLRADGINIISTWIDYVGNETDANMPDICERCISESNKCEAMIIYAEYGDYLKGAFIEMGIALGRRCVNIYMVGNVLPENSAFIHDKNVLKVHTIEEALEKINIT